MTLEERRRKWAIRKRNRRIALVRKISARALIVVAVAAVVVAAVLIFSGKAEAKEEHPLYKYYTVYEVMPGETLTSIARDHLTGFSSVSEYIEDVRFTNRMANADDIRSGQKLFVPYYSTELK